MTAQYKYSIAVGVVLAVNLPAHTQQPPTEKPKLDTPKFYESPQAVYEAYRTALAKRDKRTEHLCLTPELRDEEVCMSYVLGLGMMRDKAKADALRKKFGVEEKVITAEYNKRYKEKYGIDIEKVRTEYQDKQSKAVAEYFKKQGINNSVPGLYRVPQSVMDQVGPPPWKDDDQLLRKVVIEKNVDKVGFVVAVDKAVRPPDADPTVLGDLKNLRIQGDKATGEHTTRIFGIRRLPGKYKDERFWEDVDGGAIGFRKTKDGWLIDEPG